MRYFIALKKVNVETLIEKKTLSISLKCASALKTAKNCSSESLILPVLLLWLIPLWSTLR